MNRLIHKASNWIELNLCVVSRETTGRFAGRRSRVTDTINRPAKLIPPTHEFYGNSSGINRPSQQAIDGITIERSRILAYTTYRIFRIVRVADAQTVSRMTPVASLYGSSPRISSPPKEKFSSNGGRKPVGFSLFHFYCHPLVRFLPWKGKIGRKKEETVEPGIVPHYRWRDRGGESRSTCVGIPRKRRRSCSLMDTNLDERARISIGASSFFLFPPR